MKRIKSKNSNILLGLFVVVLVLTGLFVSTRVGYGSDPDGYMMLRTFLNLIHTGTYMPSRFSGSPVAELIVGSMAWVGGSPLASGLTFLVFVAALPLFFSAVSRNASRTRLLAFMSISLTCETLFFDNISVMDYSWAIFFFSLGLFLTTRNAETLGALAFGASMGCRLSFTVFVIVGVLFIGSRAISFNKNRLMQLFTALVIGSLFYIPIWFENNLGFNWLSAVGPGGGVVGHAGRWFFKSWLALGFVSALVVAVVLVWNFSRVRRMENFLFLMALVVSNSLMFLLIPAELSYLQPALVAIFLIFSQVAQIKSFVVLIVLQLSGWFVQVNVLEVNHKNLSICAAIVATEAQIKPSISSGRILTMQEGKRVAPCFLDNFVGFEDQIMKGLPLRYGID